MPMAERVRKAAAARWKKRGGPVTITPTGRRQPVAPDTLATVEKGFRDAMHRHCVRCGHDWLTATGRPVYGKDVGGGCQCYCHPVPPEALGRNREGGR